MIPVTSDSKETTDADVEMLSNLLYKKHDTDREVITFIPEEFTVDGFKELWSTRNDGGSEEMRGLLLYRTSYNLAHLRKPLNASWKHQHFTACDDQNSLEWRRVGATVIDMGGGQTASVAKNFTYKYLSRRWRLCFSKIFKLLKTSKLAEGLKSMVKPMCHLPTKLSM